MSMNENPNQDRRGTAPQSSAPRSPAPRGSAPTGSFKLNIDERELAAGGEQPPQGRERPEPYRNAQQAHMGYYSSDRDSKEERKAHKKRDKLKGRKNKRVFSLVWLCMVLLLGFTLASYLIGGANDFFAVGRSDGTAEVRLDETLLDADRLAQILYQRGAINKPEFFSLYSKVRVDDWTYFKPGVYQIKTNLDYEDILNQLQGGNESREEVRVTFPEGCNALEIAQLLEENEVCTQEAFLTALNEGDFSKYSAVAAMGTPTGKYYKLEGYLFPDTYDFWKGEEVESVIGKMLNNFQEKMSGSAMDLVGQSGMTLDQIVTLASIVQGEAANQSDMYNVSAVLHNRLNFGAENDIFFLECDSTTYYPYKNAEAVPQTGALPYGNYNTYSTGVSGLPAGAICNPGMDAINAALKPNTADGAAEYLYFCHAEDGTAYYASTSWEHEENLVLAGLSDGYSEDGDYDDDGGDDDYDW